MQEIKMVKTSNKYCDKQGSYIGLYQKFSEIA